MCKKSSLILFYIIFMLAFAPLTAQSQGVRVMEFYTSQGCPSCPAGDRIFADIVDNNDDIIGLGCHVTYFDRRWKDTMSRIFCDARQGAYREAGIIGKVYTPQVIINGQSEAIGSREQTVYS